jgi:hypothetical protein
VFEPDEAYTWSVVATDQKDETISESFTFQLRNEVLALEEQGSQNQYKIFPNPFDNVLVIQNPSSHDIEHLSITRMDGFEVMSSDVVIPAQGVVTLDDMGSLPRGMYLLSLRFKSSSMHTVKLVKY